MSADCEHDWRVDPRVILPSNPPRLRVVCAKCGAVTSQGASNYILWPDDPREWEKARVDE